MAKLLLDIINKSYNGIDTASLDFHGQKPSAEVRNFMKSNNWIWNSHNVPPVWQPNIKVDNTVNESYNFVSSFIEKFNEVYELSGKSRALLERNHVDKHMEDPQIEYAREQKKDNTIIEELVDNVTEYSLEKKQVETIAEGIKNGVVNEKLAHLEKKLEELLEEREKDRKTIAELNAKLEAKEHSKQIADSKKNIDEEPGFTIKTSDFLNTMNDIAREEEEEAEKKFIDANTVSKSLEETEKLTVTSDELEIAKNILPKAQYVTTLQLSNGEEGEFFKKRIKDVAQAVKNAPKLYETDGAEQHPIILRYFHPTGTETLVCEVGEEGEAYGYQCLNGDYEMAEWGYIDLHEVTGIPGMEVDYHVPEGMTIERWLYKEQPELFPEYAKFSEEKKIEKTPFDIAQETGNDVEAISAALNKTKSVENDKDYAKGLADWIIQHGLEMSTDQENYHVSFDDILEYTDTPEDWLNNPVNIQLINEALSEHDDNELLDYNPEENEEKEFNLYFCSNSDEMVENTLFKQNKEGRWVRKTEEELLNEKNQTVSLEMTKEQYDTLSERYVEAKDSIKTNFILDKLSTAGIEVITDKNIFKELLNTSNIVQKMENENISDRYFRANEAEVETFSKELDSFIADYDKSKKAINPLKLLNVGSISPVMKILGIADVPIGIDQSTISKALREEPIYPDDEQGHQLTIEELKSIPQSLADPVMVFRSDSPTRRHKDSYVFFTEHKDSKNRTVIIPVAVNKKYGRLIINKVTSIYGRNKEVRYVKDNIQRGNLVYFDKKRSLEWERECKVQFLAQVLPVKGSINNILSKDSLVKFLNSKTQNMVLDNKTYGFVYEGKIYLNPEIMNSEVAVHEYTHLWDNYIQRVNPELWHKGLDIFKNTKFWNEVKTDPNYADIAHDDNLLLSEVHAKICGKMAESILEKIIERDGELTKDTVIDWDKECWDYIATEIGFQTFNKVDPSLKITTEDLKQFLSMPMKDLMNSVNINLEQQADKFFSKVMDNQSEAHKMIYSAYEKGKSDYLNGVISDISFAEIQKDYIKSVQVPELNEILKESPNQEVGRLAALRYFNGFADDGLWKDNGNLYNLFGILGMPYEPTAAELNEFIRHTYNELHGIVTEDDLAYNTDYLDKRDRELDELHQKSTELDKKLEERWVVSQPYTFIVKDTAEFEQFAEFEPYKNLTAEKAVDIYKRLKIVGKEPGIALSIPEDTVFGKWAEKGISIVISDLEGKADFSIYGDSFILDLKEADEKARKRIDAYKELYRAFEKAGLPVNKADWIFDKENELFGNLKKTVHTNNTKTEVQPVGEIHVSNEEWNALSHLADAAKMDWFYEETYEEDNLKIQDLEDLSTAWLVQNIERLDKMEIEKIKNVFERANENGAHIELESIDTRNSIESEKVTSKKDIKAIREQCREILKKPDSEITETDKTILAQYEGAGGINEENRTDSGILNEFYTPNNLVKTVWDIVDSYAPGAKTVLEPSAGVGKFANNRPNNEFTMHELDETSARINKILHPNANIIQGAYQKQFFDEYGISRKTDFVQPKYDVVIGNPPYGKYLDEWKGKGEGKEFDRYEEYFISKGLDALKDENSVMAFVVPSGFLNTARDKQKEIIASKGKLIDAYRLPIGTFPTTEVGTDIIIMQNWDKERKNSKYNDEIFKDVIERQIYDLSDNHYFNIHKDKVLGEVKNRTNRFGKLEEYVKAHDGLSVQDELDKISSMLPKIETVEIEARNIQTNKNISERKPEVIEDKYSDKNPKIYKTLNSLKETNYFLTENFTEKNQINTKENFWRNIDEYNFKHLARDMDESINNGWRFKIFYNANTHEAMLSFRDNAIATINKNGIVTENFDSSSKDYKDLSKNIKDRIDLRIREFNDYIKHIQFSYLGNKNNSVYFRNVSFRNGFNVTIFDNDKKLELERHSTNVYGAIIGASMSGKLYENIDENYEYSNFKPLYASFESLYPEDGKIDLEKILEDDRQITMSVETQVEELVEPPQPNWRSSSEEYEKQTKALEKYNETKKRLPYNEMLKFSKLSESEYQEKVRNFTIAAVQKKNEEIEEAVQKQKEYEDKALMFETILKQELSPGKTFEYMYIPIKYEQAKEDGAIDVYIDETPAFCINTDKKSIVTYNNYDIPKNYLQYWVEEFGEEITVSNVELENTEQKISLSHILSEKPLSDNAKKTALKVAEFFADRDFSTFKKEENEQNPSKVLEIGSHKYKVESYGIHRRLFIDGSKYVAADFDIKTNILSMNNDCYKHNLYEGLEEICRNMYPNLSVKKNFIVDNIHYEDIDGTTNILPMISKIAYAPQKTELLNDRDFARIYGINWNHEDRKYWVATDWKGYIDLEKLTPDDISALPESENYFEESNGKWIHKTLFASGNIYVKIDRNEELYQEGQLSEHSYIKNKTALEQAIPKKIEINDIAVSVKSPFVRNLKFDNIPVKELFLNWATGAAFGEDSGNSRNYITDFTTSSISREDIPPTITWSDVVDYCDDIELKSIRDDEKTTKEKTDIRNQKLNDRKTTAEMLFKRFIQNGLTKEQQNIFVDQFNRTFNNDKAPDYSRLPLFISGMNKWHNGKEFTLYEQQIKGISFLSNKGNGLLAYDVGVGKTAAGICATVNQIQTERAKRPFIVVPKSVYKKWENDIHELFPEIQVNALGNLSEKVIGNYYDGNHGLKIPEGSITLLTNEALNNIAFTEKSIKTDLKQDYADLLALNDDLSSKNDRTRAEANGKILDKAGVSNKVDSSYFIFFENTGFDHVTVDEAHRFKNLFKVPRPKKGQNNEFANMGTGEPSKRALKMFNITQLIQKHNEGRNVFMLTATPFTNSPLEVYSMLSYIARKELEQQNIKDLYNFCEEYSNTKLELVVTPSNDVKLSTVMKEFNNLTGLQNILKQFIDKVDGEEADIVRPDKVVNPVIIEPTDVQKEIFDFAANEVLTYKPQDEEEKCAPVLQAMNILRIAALSPALLTQKHLQPFWDETVSCTAVIPPIEEVVDCSPKLKMCCDAIVKVWKENPTCGQVLYMPEGTNAYPHIINYMVKQGVPREVFATIEGTDATIGGKKLKGTDAREDIAQQFNDKNNKCKILIGSSAISEGMDLNGNSIALYNTMLGWNPSETTQVEGRIWRQGNKQGRVHIVYPLVEGSIDSFLYQKHDEKKSRIDDLFRYKGSTLNVAEINPEEMKWELIKDPRKRAELDLNEAKAKLNREKLMLDNQLKDYDSLIENRKLYTEKLEKRKQEKVEYENNYQKSLFDGEQRRTEEEQAAGVARYDLSISKIEGQLTNINRKLAGLDIKTSEDEINFSQNIVKKQQEIDKQIENLTSPANVMNITGKYQKIIEQEKIANLEKMLTEPLNQVIVKDKIPAHINEYNVRESRYKAVIGNIKSTPEQIEKATKKWEKFKQEYDEKYNKKTEEKQTTVKPKIPVEKVVKPTEPTPKSETKIYKAADNIYNLGLFAEGELQQNKGAEKTAAQLLDCKQIFEENSQKKENTVLDHTFMTENNFYPPFVKNGDNYIIRCEKKDLLETNKIGELKSEMLDIELTKEQFAKMIAYHKALEKLLRAEASIKEHKTPQPLTPAAVYTDKANVSKVSEKQKQLILEKNPGTAALEIQTKWQELAGEVSERVKNIEQNLTFEQKKENAVQKQNLSFPEKQRKQDEQEFDIF